MSFASTSVLLAIPLSLLVPAEALIHQPVEPLELTLPDGDKVATVTAGPAYQCIAGIAFPLRPGETLRRIETSSGSAGYWVLGVNGKTIKIQPRGGNDLRRYNAVDMAEHPIGLTQDTKAYFFPAAQSEVAQNHPGAHKVAIWRFDLAARSASTALSVSFEAGLGADTGFAFLERIEFAERDDPRCTK